MRIFSLTVWGELMLYSGTVVKVSVHWYLLFNNMHYVGGCIEGGCGDTKNGFDAMDDFTLPVEVRIECTDREMLKEEEGVLELLD
jgi:hypothetical protein